MGYYAAMCCNCLPTFQDNVSVPVKMGPICCPETSVNNYHTTPHNIPEECSSHQHNGGSLKSYNYINAYQTSGVAYDGHTQTSREHCHFLERLL
jgi:hypothetical protein